MPKIEIPVVVETDPENARIIRRALIELLEGHEGETLTFEAALSRRPSVVGSIEHVRVGRARLVL